MKAIRCEFEEKMIQALSTRSWPQELLRHRDMCADCVEAIAVAMALRQDAGEIGGGFRPLPSGQIWARAQLRRRELALARAAMCVRILTVSGLVYALLFCLWAARALGGLHSMAPAHMDGAAWNASAGGLALAVVCVAMGLIFALRGERARG